MNKKINPFEKFIFKLKIENSFKSDWLTFQNPLELNHQFFFKVRKVLDSCHSPKINKWIEDRTNFGEICFKNSKLLIQKKLPFKILISHYQVKEFKEYRQQYSFHPSQILSLKIILEDFQICIKELEIIKVQKEILTPLKPKQDFIFNQYFNEKLALYYGFLNKNNFKSFLKEGKTFENKIFEFPPFCEKSFKEILNENNRSSTKKKSRQNRSSDNFSIDYKVLNRKKRQQEFFEESDKEISKNTQDDQIQEIDIQCCICIQEFDPIKAVSSACQHEYCFQCLSEWMKIQNTCPLCKKEITKIFKFESGKKIEEINVEKRDMQVEEEIDDDLMDADNHCYKCQQQNEQNVLLVCDNCLIKCCHIFCLNPPLEFIPLEDWYCDYCVVQQGIRTILPIAGIQFPHQRRQRRRRRQRRERRQRQNYPSPIPPNIQDQQSNNQDQEISEQINLEEIERLFQTPRQQRRRINSIALRKTNSKKRVEKQINEYLQNLEEDQQGNQVGQNFQNQEPNFQEISEFLKSLKKQVIENYVNQLH